MRSKSWVGKLATPVIDLLAILAYPLLIRKLVNLFNRQDAWNILIILGAYYFMCGAILVSKRLEQNPELATKRADKGGEETVKSADGLPGWVKALSWPFAIFVFVMILMTSGIFESGNESGARLERFITGETLGTIPALVIFVSTSLFFPLVLLKKPRPKIKYGSGAHLLLRTLSVFAVNGMVLVTAAFWEWQLAGTEPMDISFAAKILVFVLAYAVFLMFYAPPRLALLSLEPSRWAYAGYVLFLGYTLWNYMT